MLGAIIGDIVGSRWEFNPTNDYNFEWLSPENNFTDDTICTVAIADALVQVSYDYKLYLYKWCNYFPCPMGGYGGSFGKWVTSSCPKPYGSYGNGSAMRVSPIGWWYRDRDNMLEAAAATAMPTHNHPEGIKGAQTVALAIFTALKYKKDAPKHVDEIVKECVEFSGYDINFSKSDVMNKFDETCQGTVPVALKIISISENFEDAVRLAVSLGADADTLGAIVGSIAEAIWGIPPKISWRIEQMLPEDIIMVIYSFYADVEESNNLLYNRTFWGKDFEEATWDMLDDEDRKRVMNFVDKLDDKKVELTPERRKAREEWDIK